MGRLVSTVDALIEECAEAGVIFHPKAGQLRPELTRGRPPDELLARVKAAREGILLRLAELMDFDTDAEAECRERDGRCHEPDDCPWLHECRTKGAPNANKC